MVSMDGRVHGGKSMPYVKGMYVVKWKAPLDEKLRCMLMGHFGFKGSLDSFKHKLHCNICLDYQRGYCEGKNLTGDQVVQCIIEQSKETIYTPYIKE